MCYFEFEIGGNCFDLMDVRVCGGEIYVILKFCGNGVDRV